MNARWQGYVEQREKYTHALEQRCSDLEKTVSQRQQHQLTDELQRRVDQILLDQRQKTELAQEARLKVASRLILMHIHRLLMSKSVGVIA